MRMISDSTPNCDSNFQNYGPKKKKNKMKMGQQQYGIGAFSANIAP